MSYIAPNTTIKILKNVPLDNNYEQTILFGSAVAQTTYFELHAKYTFDLQYYQRVKKGTLRIKQLADNLYECNYLMFRNTSFGNKWFYAFIKNVEYINNEVSEVEYELDVLQTWMFDYTLEECLIDREHASTDTIGDNIIPEKLELGEYVFNGYEPIKNITLYESGVSATIDMRDIGVIVAVQPTAGNVTGRIYDRIYGGCRLYCFESTDLSSINNLLDNYVANPDQVVSVYTVPRFALPLEMPEGHILISSEGGRTYNIQDTALLGTERLDGYLPKNKKLYTYPYNFYHIDNGANQSLELRYEFFSYLTPVIVLTANITQPVSIIARPANYKNVPATIGTGTDIEFHNALNTESIELGNYPMCSWSIDAYKAWLAQHGPALFSKFEKGVRTGAIVALTAGSMMPIISAVAPALGVGMIKQAFSDAMIERYEASIQADIFRGSINTGSNNIASKKQTFYHGRVSITNQHAQIIDKFFSRYGYACKQIKQPNINVRTRWTYTKTFECDIKGALPSDDKAKICNIFDSGITFWRYGGNIDNEIGNYSLENPIG